MIAVYVLLLLVSTAFFYFTRAVIANVIIRFAISAAIFFVFSIVITVMVSRGHTTPPGSKTVDIEEMKKIRRELNERDR